MRKQIVKIKWNYPILLDNIHSKKEINEHGIYCITRKYGSSERIIYIGKTIDSFEHRLKSHEKKWLLDVKGTIFVRLGVITSPVNYDNDLLEDVESALIYELQPPYNVSKTVNYTYRTNYFVFVVSEGFRGRIPDLIDAREHLEE